MKFRSFYPIVAATLILGAGCKKSIDPASVKLKSPAEGLQSSLPGFALTSPSARLVSFDLATGVNLILAYDISNTTPPTVIGINGTTYTNTVFTINGGGGPFMGFVNTPNLQDNFNELG